jgi:hypothetical protein
MDSRPTRTRLRLGLVSPKSASRQNGVTDEELEVLLVNEPCANGQSVKPDTKKPGKRGKPASSKKVQT